MSEAVTNARRPRPFVPHPGQKAYLASRARFRVLCAGRRAGKSEVAAYGFLTRILKDEANPTIPKGGIEPRQYWCVAPTADLTGLMARKLMTSAAALGLSLVVNKSEAGAQIRGLDIWIRFRSTYSITQLVAEDVWGLWWDEGAKSKEEAWGYLEPCLTATAGWCDITTTPEGQNWFYEQFWRRADPTDASHDPRFEGFHFTSADNPFLARICPVCKAAYRALSAPWTAGRCPAEGEPLVAEAIWKRAYLPDRVYRREYMASFQAFAGQIWEELSQGQHWAALPAVAWKRLIGGQDWNWSLPGAYVLLGEDERGRWWVLDEINQERLPVWDELGDCWVGRIKTLNTTWEKRLGARVEAIYADPALPEQIDVERRKGLPVRPADNAVSLGLQTVSVLAHPISGKRGFEDGPRLRWACERRAGGLAPSAKTLWKQANAYRFKPGSEEPVKENDHACDALRYALHSTAGKTVGAISMGMGRIS